MLNEEEDEEDDSDWEHLQQRTTPIEFVKWCCVNCTMANPGDMLHCYVHFFFTFSCFSTIRISYESVTKVDSFLQICGEHKESGILRHGYLASPFFKDTGLAEVEEKCGGRC